MERRGRQPGRRRRLSTGDTTTVSVEVLAFEPIRGSGRLIGLAIVELVLDGVAITLQGVKLTRQPDGGLKCDAPCFRHPDGRWLPAVCLPEELARAIGDAVFAEANGG